MSYLVTFTIRRQVEDWKQVEFGLPVYPRDTYVASLQHTAATEEEAGEVLGKMRRACERSIGILPGDEVTENTEAR